MGKKIKLTETQLENVVNEAMGFSIPTYQNQALDELDALIKVMSGPITNLRKNKTFPDDEPVVQRIYQLVAEGGELHVKVQELIDLLESLEDRQKKQLGFRTSSYS